MPAAALVSEHEELLEFLYRCPLGLAQFDDVGAITLCNSAFSRLMMPLLPQGALLHNLVEALLPFAPTLPSMLQSPVESGTLCDDHRLDLDPTHPGREPGVLSLTIVRLAPDRHMAVLSDVTLQVAQERQVRKSEEASTRARIAEAENRALEDKMRVQERMREVLRQSENKFRRLFESSSSGILIVDTSDGLILDANPAMLTLVGYRRTDVVGRALWDVDVFTALVAGRSEFQALQETQYRRYHDVALRTGTGRVVDVEVTSLLYSDDGKDKIQLNVQDITERKAINRWVVHAQKMTAVGILTGGLAHNINNLLAVIVGNLELLQERFAGAGSGLSYAREALDAALRGGALISSMLAFAREQPLRLHELDVQSTLAKIANTFGEILGDNITLVTQFGEEACWPVLSDDAQLEASILNLVTNAIEAMPSGGVLTISACNRRLAITPEEITSAIPGEYVEIAVSDTGIGMPAETAERVFEPFFTTKGLATKQGTGLGLSTVFGFARQSGGDVLVESAVSKGTTFRLYLPRCNGGQPVVEQPAARKAKDGSETILLVEDNEALSNIISRQLARLGYKVLQTRDGPSALAALSGDQVDLLFTDIVLPGGMGGVELARVAREAWPLLKVVLTTGFNDSVNQDEARDLTLIMKPYLMADLARTLRSVFEESGVR